MGRRRTKSRKPARKRHGKATKPKPQQRAPTAARKHSSSVADLQEKLDARTRQLNEAIERENATAEVLRTIQNDLFDVGADLCTPVVENPQYPPLRVDAGYVERLEGWCDRFNEGLPKLDSFLLPGGTPGAALLHQARTLSRRAERSAWALFEADRDDDTDAVLSDDQVVAELRRSGIAIALRTVTKYRESLGIPSSVERRRAKALAG